MTAQPNRQHRLPRTGGPPLAFTGAQLAQAATPFDPEEPRERGQRLTIYRSTGADLIAHAEYRSTWKAEKGRDTVLTVTYPHRGEPHLATVEQWQALAAILAEHDSSAFVLGYPATPHFQMRQAQLLKSIRADWQALVSAALGQIPEATERLPEVQP